MPYLGLYDSTGVCIRCVEITDGEVERAHLELLMEIVNHSKLTLITTDRKPKQRMVKRKKKKR